MNYQRKDNLPKIRAMSTVVVDKQGPRIRKMFGAIAPRYDLLNHLLSLNVDKHWRKKTTQLVPPIGNAPILDLCTGTGDLALAYQKLATGPIIGSDFCHPMLVRAVEKTKRTNINTIQYVEADAQYLPFPDNQFQIVTVAFGLRNVSDFRRGLAEMARVALPGGRVAILEFSKPRHWFFGRAYRFYFRHILPKVGQMCSRSPDSAYEYLPASVMEFPDYEDLLAEMQAVGLTSLRYHPMTFGIATLYVGVKIGLKNHE
jgi:demethylmenaquinone methyltransferase/2-methoxy-6-polyprenyl-1,4-benzoquinol methylase